jgi:hypothetical protein
MADKMRDFLVAACAVAGAVLLAAEDTAVVIVGLAIIACAIYSVKDDQ